MLYYFDTINQQKSIKLSELQNVTKMADVPQKS